jgi:hypothetical protein
MQCAPILRLFIRLSPPRGSSTSSIDGPLVLSLLHVFDHQEIQNNGALEKDARSQNFECAPSGFKWSEWLLMKGRYDPPSMPANHEEVEYDVYGIRGVRGELRFLPS